MEYNRKYREANRKIICQKAKEKYHENKEKITCICGKELTKCNKKRHEKTQTHLKNLNL